MNFLILLSTLSSLFFNLENKTLQTDIYLSVQEQGQAALTSPGKVIIQGEQFAGTARGYEVAYDGTTFYLYDPDTKELTLSNPTEEELMTINPLLYVKYMSEVNTVQEYVSKDGTSTTITMVPQGTSDEQVKLTIKLKQDMIQSVEIREPKRITTLRFKNSMYTAPQSNFTISKPDAYINDLR